MHSLAIPIKKKILSNIGWLFFDKVLRISGGLFIGIWVARYLGPNHFGALSYALAYVFLFGFLGNLGLDQIVVRNIEKFPEQTASILGTAFYLKIFGGILAICFVSLSVIIIKPSDPMTRYIILILMVGFVFKAVDVIDFFFQSQIRSKYVVIARNSAFIISSGLKVYAILNCFSVYWFSGLISFELFLAGILLIYMFTHSGHRMMRWEFNKKIAVSLFKSSWPLMFSVFLIAVYMRVDQIMIGYYLNNSEVGLYGVAVRLSEAWYFVPAIITSTLLPYFVSLRETNHELYLSRLNALYSFMFWMGVVVGVLAILWGQEAISFLFGEAYKDSYAALVFNIWAGIFVSQSLARGMWLISEELQKYRMYTNVFGVTINILGNMWLIPKFGISGAAVATLATQGISTWVISLFWKPLRESTMAMIKSSNPMWMMRFAMDYRKVKV